MLGTSASKPVFEVRRNDFDLMVRSAIEAYPEECCGLLVGIEDGDRFVVKQICSSLNCYQGDRRRRYQIEPQFAYDVFRDAALEGLSVLGFYHSHPDGTTHMSKADCDEAWFEKLYIIMGTDGTAVTDYKGWVVGVEGRLTECQPDLTKK